MKAYRPRWVAWLQRISQQRAQQFDAAGHDTPNNRRPGFEQSAAPGSFLFVSFLEQVKP